MPLLEQVLLVFLLLQFKHFVCDFLLQGFPYMYLNKGTYGHPGGILHSGVHLVGSLVTLPFLLPLNAVMWIVCLAEFFAHYHIDWAKMKLNKKYGWACNNSEYFWWLLGFDQFLHQVCYGAMLWFLFTAG